jgi:hypothetical protein
MSTKNEIQTLSTDSLVTATGGAGRIAAGGNYSGFGGFGAHPWLGSGLGLGWGGWGGGLAAANAAAANQSNQMMECCALASMMRPPAPRGPYG